MPENWFGLRLGDKNMMYYNSKNNGFYDSNINDIPGDSVEISDEYHAELLEKQSNGLVIQSDENGYPIAVEHVLTVDEIIMINTAKQQKLLNEANKNISILQDAIDFDMSEDGDEEKLKAWKKYRILLNRIDTSDINVIFPEKPE